MILLWFAKLSLNATTLGSVGVTASIAWLIIGVIRRSLPAFSKIWSYTSKLPNTAAKPRPAIFSQLPFKQ